MSSRPCVCLSEPDKASDKRPPPAPPVPVLAHARRSSGRGLRPAAQWHCTPLPGHPWSVVRLCQDSPPHSPPRRSVAGPSLDLSACNGTSGCTAGSPSQGACGSFCTRTCRPQGSFQPQVVVETAKWNTARFQLPRRGQVSALPCHLWLLYLFCLLPAWPQPEPPSSASPLAASRSR